MDHSLFCCPQTRNQIYYMLARDQSESSELQTLNRFCVLCEERLICALRDGIMTEWYYLGSANCEWTPHLLEWSSGSIKRCLLGSSGITTHLSLTRQMGKHPSRKRDLLWHFDVDVTWNKCAGEVHLAWSYVLRHDFESGELFFKCFTLQLWNNTYQFW